MAETSGQAGARDRAETIALQALGWLVSDSGQLDGFLALTGATPEDLRARATDPAFLASVLEFLLGEDARVQAFCADLGLDPTEPMRAAQILAGPRFRHWT